jgi:peptidoglycan/LPS O-acetylase OafA/YrhL
VPVEFTGRPGQSGTVTRFDAIEGARGWLATGVLFVHTCALSQTPTSKIATVLNSGLGVALVMAFVIISGFVITHLLLTRNEPYPAYIFRRFMRIFPVFAVTCYVGYLCTPLFLAAVSRRYGDNNELVQFASCMNQGQIQYFWANFLAHLTMFHGVISAKVLPCSATTFNGPAWSLSLEWQFYLAAPLVIALARRETTSLAALAGITVLCLGARHGDFGQYEHLSFLPLAIPYFALGIASRVIYPKLVTSVTTPAVALGLLGTLVPLGWKVLPVVIWGILLVFLVTDRRALLRMDAAIMRLGAQLLESPFARFVGKRSYSIYLFHFPILGALTYSLPLNGLQLFAALLAIGGPLTLLISSISYHLVERPGITLSNRVANSLRHRGNPSSSVVSADD